jgi:hypothetical protein
MWGNTVGIQNWLQRSAEHLRKNGGIPYLPRSNVSIRDNVTFICVTVTKSFIQMFKRLQGLGYSCVNLLDFSDRCSQNLQ